MILDERTEAADSLAISTAAPGLYTFGDTVDTGAAGNLFDTGIYLVLVVASTFTSGGAASVRFHLASDAQGAIATDGSASVHFTTATLPLSALVAGVCIAALPLPAGSYERFVGVLQEIVGAAFTGGAVDAFYTTDPALYRSYSDNVS